MAPNVVRVLNATNITTKAESSRLIWPMASQTHFRIHYQSFMDSCCMIPQLSDEKHIYNSLVHLTACAPGEARPSWSLLVAWRR
jgi:hypothetical protein